MKDPINRELKWIDAAIAIVLREGRILVCRRCDHDTFGGYWEFPGGKCEDGESLEQCVHRELREEIDIEVRLIRRLPDIDHIYSGKLLRLHPFLCQHVAGEPKLIECQDARWIDPPTLSGYQFPPANEKLLQDIIALCTTGELFNC